MTRFFLMSSMLCFSIALMSYLLSKPNGNLGWNSYSSSFGAFVFVFATVLGAVCLILYIAMIVTLSKR